MKYSEFESFNPINKVDEDRVREIANSILENGWRGMPILVCESFGYLITGSHRLAALKLIEEENEDFYLDDLGDIAEDVTDEINAYCEEHDETIDTIPYDNLSAIFAGTWVEQYKDELVEW